MANFSEEVTLSHEAHHPPEQGPIRGSRLEHVQHGGWHMTTRGAFTKRSAGTSEVWVLAVKQTMVLIINLPKTTTQT
jgi:hypothetical protein